MLRTRYPKKAWRLAAKRITILSNVWTKVLLVADLPLDIQQATPHSVLLIACQSSQNPLLICTVSHDFRLQPNDYVLPLDGKLQVASSRFNVVLIILSARLYAPRYPVRAQSKCILPYEAVQGCFRRGEAMPQAASWTGTPSIKGSTESMRMVLLTTCLIGMQ